MDQQTALGSVEPFGFPASLMTAAATALDDSQPPPVPLPLPLPLPHASDQGALPLTLLAQPAAIFAQELMCPPLTAVTTHGISLAKDLKKGKTKSALCSCTNLKITATKGTFQTKNDKYR